MPTCQFSVPHLLAEKAPTAGGTVLGPPPPPNPPAHALAKPRTVPSTHQPSHPSHLSDDVETARHSSSHQGCHPDAVSARPAPPTLSTAYAMTTPLPIKPCSPPCPLLPCTNCLHHTWPSRHVSSSATRPPCSAGQWRAGDERPLLQPLALPVNLGHSFLPCILDSRHDPATCFPLPLLFLGHVSTAAPSGSETPHSYKEHYRPMASTAPKCWCVLNVSVPPAPTTTPMDRKCTPRASTWKPHTHRAADMLHLSCPLRRAGPVCYFPDLWLLPLPSPPHRKSPDHSLSLTTLLQLFSPLQAQRYYRQRGQE